MIPPKVLPSESQTGIWTSCVWLTGLYIARAFNPAVPATKAEMLRIAAAGGNPTGASGNFTKLAAAMKALYGLVGKVYEGAALAQPAVLAAAAAGPHAVGLAGDQLNLTPHYQSNSLGHAIAVLYPSGSTGIQLDPLAAAGYAGDPFPSTELAKFATAAIVFKEAAVTVATVENFAPPRAWSLVAPANIAGYSIDLTTGAVTVKIPAKPWTSNSSAHTNQRLTLNGKSYLRVVDGVYAGSYVLQGPSAVLQPAPVSGISQAKYDADVAAAKDVGLKAGADDVLEGAKARAIKYGAS